MRFFSLLFIIWILPYKSTGQVVFTTSQILSTGKYQPKLKLQERKLVFHKNSSFELPLINRWEFRTQTHDLDLTEQRFTFRIRPNSRKERIGQKQIHYSIIQLLEEESKKVLLDGLQKRYNTCLTLIMAKKRKVILKDLEEVYKELASAYEINEDIDNLIESEESQNDFSLQSFDYQRYIESAFRQVQYYLNNKGNFEFQDSDFISITQIKKRLKEINDIEPIFNPSLSILENEINVLDKELFFESAQQKKWFSFAQLRYGGVNPLTPFRETLSLSFAFQLPVKGNSFLRINQLALAKIEAENKWKEANYLADKERKRILRDLNSWLKRYEQLTQNLVATQEKITKSYNVNYQDNYNILSLKIRAHLLKKKLRLHQIEEKIYQSYLDWLNITGRMIELPLVNHLTSTKQSF